MLIRELLDELGYADSPFFLKKGTRSFSNAQNVGHILRTATKPACGLQGVYSLNDQGAPSSSPTPIVYVCKAETEADADEIHRLVWNQDIAPFLIVRTPKGIKFYSGFEYSNSGNGHLTNLLAFNEGIAKAKEFHADEINSGRFWKGWSNRLRPERRVNRKLLDNLKSLDDHLQNSCDLSRRTSHALIGKYVYLHYLRDRDILSDRKLDSWGVTESQIFGSNASITKLKTVVRNLEGWLNGNIFPIAFGGQDAPKSEHVQLVAGIFNGDDMLPSGDRQLSLDFKAYDFSYIPIETLSVVYEQFLHTPDEDGKSKGKAEGAYYTPIPIVNYILSEMEEALPLENGVRVFDPACGSGAFLVQCYRRLIEKTYPHHKHPTVHPIDLRKLLVNNIYGLDRDEDACAVSELSLLLTLLDYVDPPDLEDDKRVKLPTLRNKNIFHADFFDPLPSPLKNKAFDWIVGNPPWKKLNPRKLDNDRPAWKWMQDNEIERPVGDNQLARAFAWRVADMGGHKSQIGLFMPAMTLFADKAVNFRKSFFEQMHLKCIANFSNLAEVISAGRFRVPSAAFIFVPYTNEVPDLLEREFVRVFSPLVANQEPARPSCSGQRIESWCIVINESEIRDIPYGDIATGAGMPWKIAAWGSLNDARLLKRIGKRFPSLSGLENEELIVISEGPALRSALVAKGEYQTAYKEELVGKRTLNTKALSGYRKLFLFPISSLPENTKLYVSKRAGIGRKLEICRAPHIIVSAARTFSIYTDDYLVVPPRQIGIISPSDDRDFLKALSLYLSSDFVFFHQFFTTTQFGVKRDVATLDSLKRIPCPLTGLSKSSLKQWSTLHQKLTNTTPRRVGDIKGDTQTSFLDDGLDDLLVELNNMVAESLELTERDRTLVSDLVNVRLELNDGKVGRPAVENPTLADIKRYGERLRQDLDGFLGPGSEYRHAVDIIFDQATGMICVDFVKSKRVVTVKATSADRPTARALAETRNNLQKEIGQWVYFNRDLRIYDGTKTYLFKPMQRFHWTESQAMVDASEMIAETVSAEGAID